VFNTADVFETPCGGGTGVNPAELSTSQFREACRMGTVADQFLNLLIDASLRPV
jgi:hypothetical protein